jgi:hypothetical protein
MGGGTGSYPGGNLGEQIKTGSALDPVSLSAGATNGIIIDRLGFNSVVFACMTGVVNTYTSTAFKVQHDTDPAGGTMADLAAAAANSEEWGDVTVTNTVAATTIELNCDLRRANRYIRIVATETGTSALTAVSYALGANVLGGPV